MPSARRSRPSLLPLSFLRPSLTPLSLTRLSLSRLPLARPSVGQALLVLTAAVLLALVVAESWDTRFVPTAVGTVVSGALCLAALVVPVELLPRAAALAMTASAVLSVVSANLDHRPEHTPGMVELCALLALAARTVRHLRLLKATAFVAGASVAVALVPLRLSDADHEHLNLLETALSVCVVAAVLAGLCLRLRDRLRAREREGIRQAQRLEYARDLHDFVAHHVTAIVAQTRAARFTAAQGREQDPAELDRMLEGIENAASQSLSSMRGMVSVLRSSAPPRAPAGQELAHVLKGAVEDFSVCGPPPVTVDVDPRLSGRRLPPGLVDVAHGVVREALTNARRYAPGATSVVVTASPRPGPPETLHLSVTDDGTGPGISATTAPGIAATRTSAPGHDTSGHDTSGDDSGDDSHRAEVPCLGGGFGLTGLAERVQGAGGRFTAGPREGGGWRVEARFPLPPAT
ncbi:sensor histidine kinase [Streptomyces winkii]|uniref:sensor histidine kinase n=1 Tax=Streptomyces winkii TaxID=3051178 RepID=UPI0028D55C9C|nr:histidine kinase [Streptomyces sp. DSM 40971]